MSARHIRVGRYEPRHGQRLQATAREGFSKLLRLPGGGFKSRRVRLRKLPVLINNNNCSEWRHMTEFLRGGHRDADAAVAYWPGGYRGAAVNRHSLSDVVRVVQHSQRTLVPSRDLAKDGESPPGCDGSSSSPFGSKPLPAAGRDRQRFHHMARAVHDNQSLPA